MALLKWGALVVDGRGKLGGHVLSKNRSGAIIRTKVTPANPQTSAQQAARQLLGSLSSGWSDLTQAQRTAWNEAVSEYTKTNVFGDTKQPTGKNLYTGLNTNLAQVGAPGIDVPALPVEFVPISLIGFTVSNTVGTTTDLNFEVQNFSDNTDVELLLFATPPLSPGVSSVDSQYRLLDISTYAPTGEEWSVGLPYEEKYGIPATGRKIFIKVVMVSTVSGQKSVPLSASVLVTD